jgi:hypothetical protein
MPVASRRPTWKVVREALLITLGIPRQLDDDAPGHVRRTVVIAVGVIVIAVVMIAITMLAHGYF